MYAHIYNYHIANILSTTRSDTVKSSLSYIIETNKTILDAYIELYNKKQKLERQLKNVKDENKLLWHELNKYKKRYDYGDASDKEKIYELTEENDSLKIEIKELQLLKETLQEEKIDLESISNSVFPINVNVHIDSANIISDKNMDKNDCYNKDLMFDTFTIEIKNDKAWIQVNNQPKFLVGTKNEKGKTINYKALFDDPNKRYVIKCNEVTHQLIVNDKTFQEFIADTSIKRMFTFIEYNENYDSEHAKNFNYNCDQVAAVLLPYIWEQLPTEDKIRMNKFVKIITVFKFDNKGIKANEFRFIIIYKESNGDLKYYEVDKNIKFNTNISFNFIEQNLYCKNLKTFGNIDVLNNNRENIQQHVRNNLTEAWNNSVTNNNVLLFKNKDTTDAKKIEYRFDFDFNQTITSDNLPQFFLTLKNYCRFEIINKTELKRMTSEIKILKSKYNNKILNHYVSSFTDEEFDKIDLSTFDGLIEPDTVVVSY